ncbi:MAG: terminase [Epulopiscium sp. Nuni2H_MBin001]|nr:MAG: terminase [Epulopiscium sp. Nuni2H_MBin001]
MGRPAKSVDLMSKNLTKDEISNRKQTEDNLRGDTDKLIAPPFLNRNQIEIFNYILTELTESSVLGNLDVYILSICAIAIDRLIHIENLINQDFDMVADKAVKVAKTQYTKDFYRCCNELCLSPQSRAKLANIKQSSQDDDPLLKALMLDD